MKTKISLIIIIAIISLFIIIGCYDVIRLVDVSVSNACNFNVQVDIEDQSVSLNPASGGPTTQTVEVTPGDYNWVAKDLDNDSVVFKVGFVSIVSGTNTTLEITTEDCNYTLK